MDPSTEPFQIPFQSTRYEWIEYFGGNMADVYLAKEVRTERNVIVKVLKVEYCTESELQLRFAQEARLACQCQHPNIVATYYADEQDGRPYIAMEHLQGETIRALIQRGGIETQEQAIWIGLQLALALGYLEAAQIVHRDLKPDNVVVDSKYCAKLLDFGVARLKDSRLTEFGVRIGTLKYMSPEQVKSDPLTFLSDMYAFGVLLFEMLTFQLPYKAEGIEEFFNAILRQEPNLALLAEAKVPAEVVAVIKRCLEKEPEKRFSSFSEIAVVLRRFVMPERLEQFCAPVSTVAMKPGEAGQKTKWPLILAGIAATLVVALIAVFFMTRKAPVAVPVGAPAVVPGTVERLVKSPSGDMGFVDAGVALLGQDAKPVNVRAFYIDLTEVTNDAYAKFCRETGSASGACLHQGRGDYPVVNVSFEDAAAFARWAKKRLPTAAEWEKAARGAKGQKLPWGDEWRKNAANVPHDPAAAKTAKLVSVDAFGAFASPYGELNMVGNVWEWVNATAVPDERQFAMLQKSFSPPLQRTEAFYETRGGSFRYPIPKGAEPDLIFDNRPMPARTREDDLGFRCARDQ